MSDDLRTRCEREIEQWDKHDRYRDDVNAGEPWEVSMARDWLDKDATCKRQALKLARIHAYCIRINANDMASEMDMGRRQATEYIKSIIESEVKP